MVLSLQGCMAAGKTTAARYLQAHAPDVHVCFEDNAAVLHEIADRKLDKNRYEDYIEIQRLWLQKEVERWREAQAHPCCVMDFGAEEIEFYTLHYPASIGENWEIERALQKELDAVRACLPERVLFLHASEAVLRQRKEQDVTRSRRFFEHYVKYFLPMKQTWFFQKSNVDVLNVDRLSPDEVGEKVLEWVYSQYRP